MCIWVKVSVSSNENILIQMKYNLCVKYPSSNTPTLSIYIIAKKRKKRGDKKGRQQLRVESV